METVRIALPGYDALTDTNLDHFSLYSDIDNILIKRKASGINTIADGAPTILTIPHNLGYIPFFMVYYLNETTSTWEIVNNQYNPFSVPQQICAIDTTNLYIYNFGGHASGSIQVAYDIFYDNMNDNTAPSITESPKVFKVVRPGIDASVSLNPNDYIMHSDLNNFKILSSGQGSGDIAGTGSISFAHGATIQTPYKYIVFIKFKDGKTILMGGTSAVKSFGSATTFFTTQIDATNIIITYVHQSATPSTPITVQWYIFGSGVDNTVDNAKPVIAVAKTGHNAKTETNPDNFNFHSKYPTLKYYHSGVYTMTVSDNTVVTIPHNLGYVPFFIGFVQDLAGIILNGYAIMPYYWARSSLASPTQDIAAFMYADDTNIYLKAYFQANAIGTNATFNFYYKIFKNNLNL